jgi:hypothetical protein
MVESCMIKWMYKFGDLSPDFSIDAVSGLATTSFILSVFEVLANGSDCFGSLIDLFVIVLSWHRILFIIYLLFFINIYHSKLFILIDVDICKADKAYD